MERRFQIGREARITQAGDTRFFAGWRSDPFFCDVEGAKNKLAVYGDDFFADKDVCCIVLEYLNSALGAKGFACGRARLRQVMAAGSKWSAEPGLRKRSYLSKRKVPTSEVNRRTMSVSLPPSRTLWSTQVDIRRLRRSAWRGHCSQMFCLMTLRARRLFPITGRTLTDDAFDSFIRILTNGKVKEDKVGPHGDLFLDFPLCGATSPKPCDESAA